MTELYSYMKKIKDDLHKHPEASLKEFRTTKIIQDELKKMGIEIFSNNAMQTGVIAYLLSTKQDYKNVLTIALRADIDALIGNEEIDNDIPDKVYSENAGLFHGCGHDFHTASLLGTAKILSQQKENLTCNVVFIFQPAEETMQGAKQIISNNIFNKLPVKPDVIFGIHNRPEEKTGQIVVNDGYLMAGKTNFKITITGKTGHGGTPHLCIDPLVCGTTLVNALQTIVSRNIDPQEACVFSVCSFNCGTEENFAPEQAILTGSIRALNNSVRQNAQSRLQEILKGICQSFDCSYAIDFLDTAPSVINGKLGTDKNEVAIKIAKQAAQKTVGKENVISVKPALSSEDFSLYTQQIPGVLYWLGSGFDGKLEDHGKKYPWHNTKFYTNDKALLVAANTYANSVLCAGEVE